VRVRARNAQGDGPPSNEVQVAVPSCVGTPSPGRLTANVNGSLLGLSWEGLPEAALDYIVEAGTAPGLSDIGEFPVGGLRAMSAAVPSGTYYVRVRSRSRCGVSSPSNEVLVQVGTQAPGTPTGLTASVIGRTVTISWAAPSSGGSVISYILEAGTSAATPGNLLVRDVGPVTTMSVPDVPIGSYYVRVRAANASGQGEPDAGILVTVR
jgi:predicted phage tail protein